MSSKRPEAAAKKSVNAVTKELGELQLKARTAASDLELAFIEKSDELEAKLKEISEKNEELEDLYGKEEVLQEMQALKDELEDKKREHGRALASLQVEYDDQLAELKRRHQATNKAEQQKLEDDRRARKIAWEDEDRQRNLEFQERTGNLDIREAKLSDLQMELGDFKENVEKKVNKQVAIIKREIGLKAESEATKAEADRRILEAKVTGLLQDKSSLEAQLAVARNEVGAAVAKAQAIAISAMDKDAGKQALEELRGVSQTMASTKK